MILAYGNSNSQSCFKTVETLVFSYTEALGLMEEGSSVVHVPEGLFTMR